MDALGPNLVHFKHSWAPLLRAQSPSHILTAPAFRSDVQARRWEQLGGLYLESSLFFRLLKMRAFSLWEHEDRKWVWLVKGSVVDILCLGASDV